MNSVPVFFTSEQGLLLIKLLFAQIISDFVLQTTVMVENKKWFSRQMLLHIVIVYASTALFSGLWILSGFITIAHWFIDGVKIELRKKEKFSESALFIADQSLHVAVILIAWAWYFKIFDALGNAIALPVNNYKISLILLGYAMVVWPVGYLIKYATQNMKKLVDGNDVENETRLEHGGKLIGQFERIIILTFVLLNQYEAIGFLITGKSIMRFAQQREHLRSEYVLVGTMMSYAVSILTGVLLNWLFSIIRFV